MASSYSEDIALIVMHAAEKLCLLLRTLSSLSRIIRCQDSEVSPDGGEVGERRETGGELVVTCADAMVLFTTIPRAARLWHGACTPGGPGAAGPRARSDRSAAGSPA